MTKEQFLSVTSWQKETFPNATAFSKVQHLKEEVEELSIDVAFDGLGKTMEFADCFLLLFGAAAASGMTYENICQAIDEKMSINRQRKWGNPDENGVVKHIEEDNEDDFQCCDNCDLPDACADFGCAIKQGIRKTVEW